MIMDDEIIWPEQKVRICTPAQALIGELKVEQTRGVKIYIKEELQYKLAIGYDILSFAYHGNLIALTIKETLPDLIELNTIQLQGCEPRQGIGTLMMDFLTSFADEYKIRIWLECMPFGVRVETMPQAKLAQWYGMFGFFRISKVEPEWLNEYHHKYYLQGKRFIYPMLRLPM